MHPTIIQDDIQKSIYISSGLYENPSLECDVIKCAFPVKKKKLFACIDFLVPQHDTEHSCHNKTKEVLLLGRHSELSREATPTHTCKVC